MLKYVTGFFKNSLLPKIKYVNMDLFYLQTAEIFI